MRLRDGEQQSTSLRTWPPQQRYQAPSTFVVMRKRSATWSQIGVRGAGGSGRPSASVSTWPRSLTAWPLLLTMRPALSTGLPSLARSAYPRVSIRGSPVGCGQESVV
jgi:hypothetical protein